MIQALKQATEGSEITVPGSVGKPCGCGTWGVRFRGEHSSAVMRDGFNDHRHLFNLNDSMNSYILWLDWAARPVQSPHGLYHLCPAQWRSRCPTDHPKKTEGKGKEYFSLHFVGTIIWVLAPHWVTCPGWQSITGHRHSWIPASYTQPCF